MTSTVRNFTIHSGYILSNRVNGSLMGTLSFTIHSGYILSKTGVKRAHITTPLCNPLWLYSLPLPLPELVKLSVLYNPLWLYSLLSIAF